METISFNGYTIQIPKSSRRKYERLLKALSYSWKDVRDIARDSKIPAKIVGRYLGSLCSIGLAQKRMTMNKGKFHVLYRRVAGRCSCCGAKEDLYVMSISPAEYPLDEKVVTICSSCRDLILEFINDIKETYESISPKEDDKAESS